MSRLRWEGNIKIDFER